MITNIYNAAASNKDITQSIAGRAFDSGGKKAEPTRDQNEESRIIRKNICGL